MKRILFSGCSFVSGYALEDEHRNPGHFSRILANNLFDKNYTIDNIAVDGYSNQRIFLDSAASLIKNQYDYAFVCWTSYPRYYCWVGLETYNVEQCFTPNMSQARDLNTNDISWKEKDIIKIGNSLLLLNHGHYEIRDLVSYVNVLISVANNTKTKIFFVNNILPFDQGYFDHIDGSIIPSMLTKYTNELLNSHNRDDAEINELYHMMHRHYVEKGGINEKHWLNLYQNFFNMRVDFADDNEHPGLNSHKLFADLLIEEFKKHN